MREFFQHDTTRDIVIEVEFEPALEYRAFKSAAVTSIPMLRYTVTHYKVDAKQGKKGQRRLEMKCLDRDGEELSVLAEAPKKGKPHQYRVLATIPPEVREQVPVIFVGADRRLADQLPASGASLLRRLLEDVDAALRKTTVLTEVEGNAVDRSAHDLFMERLRSALEVLRIPEFITLEETLRTRGLENLGVRSQEGCGPAEVPVRASQFDGLLQLVIFREAGVDIEATDMGAGAQNALILAIFQAYERLHKQGAIFLIEEPEMYLHPHRRRFFYQVMRRLSVDNQILYTTHSTHFVAIPEYQGSEIGVS